MHQAADSPPERVPSGWRTGAAIIPPAAQSSGQSRDRPPRAGRPQRNVEPGAMTKKAASLRLIAGTVRTPSAAPDRRAIEVDAIARWRCCSACTGSRHAQPQSDGVSYLDSRPPSSRRLGVVHPGYWSPLLPRAYVGRRCMTSMERTDFLPQ